MSSLCCRFLHDFYTFIEHMLPAYVADLGYCLLGKRPRYLYFYLKDFQSYFCKIDKLYSRQWAILNKICPAFVELWLPTFSFILVYFSKTLIIFMQDGEDLQSFAQSHRDTDLLHHAFLGVVLQQSGHADKSHVTWGQKGNTQI